MLECAVPADNFNLGGVGCVVAERLERLCLHARPRRLQQGGQFFVMLRQLVAKDVDVVANLLNKEDQV